MCNPVIYNRIKGRPLLFFVPFLAKRGKKKTNKKLPNSCSFARSPPLPTANNLVKPEKVELLMDRGSAGARSPEVLAVGGAPASGGASNWSGRTLAVELRANEPIKFTCRASGARPAARLAWLWQWPAAAARPTLRDHTEAQSMEEEEAEEAGRWAGSTLVGGKPDESGQRQRPQVGRQTHFGPLWPADGAGLPNSWRQSSGASQAKQLISEIHLALPAQTLGPQHQGGLLACLAVGERFSALHSERSVSTPSLQFRLLRKCGARRIPHACSPARLARSRRPTQRPAN